MADQGNQRSDCRVFGDMKAQDVKIYELTDEDIATFTAVADRTWENMKSVYGGRPN